MTQSNRRMEQRVRKELKARIGVETVPQGGGEPVVGDIMPCTISDLSLGGARIAAVSHRTVVQSLRVHLYIEIDNSGRTLELSGLVRWLHVDPGSPAHAFGVEFLVPEKKTLDRWLEYVEKTISNAPPKDLIEDRSDDPWPW
jgi:hypothetical protein